MNSRTRSSELNYFYTFLIEHFQTFLNSSITRELNLFLLRLNKEKKGKKESFVLVEVVVQLTDA